MDKIPSGVPGLDALTYGGLPKGRSTLICGKSGTCKSLTALQVAGSMARSGMPVLVLTVEETPTDLVESGDALGFQISELVAAGKMMLTDLTPPMDGPTIVQGEYDVGGLVHRIEQAAAELGARAVVLDSATALFNPRPPEAQLRTHFFHLVHTFRRLGLTAVITAEARDDYGPLTTLGVEDFVCDLVLVMRNTVDGERRRRSVEVHKYRRSAHYKGQYPATLSARGLTIFPLDVRVPKETIAAERYSSGLPGLDEMNAGGWLRDSIVLVRGPSGSGKTTLCGMYARAGALRGERVVYYGFEETKPILQRNFAAIGMPMQELEQQELLRLVCRYPEATSPEDMLIDLRVGLDEFKPSLVVLDSISSIEHATSEQGFRQFMVGFSALLREHGRSALLTQTIGGRGVSDLGAPYLSTIPDAILLMEYDVDQPDLRRSLRVLKMRGSPHATAARRLNISQGGLSVQPIP